MYINLDIPTGILVTCKLNSFSVTTFSPTTKLEASHFILVDAVASLILREEFVFGMNPLFGTLGVI